LISSFFGCFGFTLISSFFGCFGFTLISSFFGCFGLSSVFLNLGFEGNDGCLFSDANFSRNRANCSLILFNFFYFLESRLSLFFIKNHQYLSYLSKKLDAI
jgi:hypothetical protein